MILPASFFFLKIVLGIWGLLCSIQVLKGNCLSFVKNAIGSLIRIALNL